MAPTVQPANGLDNWILKSRLPYYDLQGGDYFEEIWSGLYSTVDSQVDVLKGRGATSVRPSKGGAVCELTATFPGKNADEPGGGGASSLILTEYWSSENDIIETDLRAFPGWGPHPDLTASQNYDRAALIARIDERRSRGILDSSDYFTGYPMQKKYATLAALGIRGYMRAAKMLVRTLTYARGDDATDALSSESDFTVVDFSAIPDKPSWLPEPKHKDSNKDGGFELLPYKWLTMPAEWGTTMGRVFTVSRAWRGALQWDGTLYEGGRVTT